MTLRQWRELSFTYLGMQQAQPAKLTCQIKEAATAEALLCTHSAHKNYLDHIH